MSAIRSVEEWSVVWTDMRLPIEIREQRASARDEAHARYLEGVWNLHGLKTRVEHRTVTVTPWATTKSA